MTYKDIARNRILEMTKGLKELCSSGVEVDLGILLMRNYHDMKNVASSINFFGQLTDEYKKFDKNRVELCKKYAQKDENGKPTKPGKESYIIDPDRYVEWEEKIEQLRKKNKIVIEEQTEKVKKFNEDLKKTEKVNIIPIPVSLIKKQKTIIPEQMERIYELIDWEA